MGAKIVNFSCCFLSSFLDAFLEAFGCIFGVILDGLVEVFFGTFLDFVKNGAPHESAVNSD